MGFLGITERNVSMDELPENHFMVVHPLNDAPEEKVDTSGLGPIKMTPSVRWSLYALRGYLILMILLVAYHVIDLAGFIGHHAH
jgi:hypothetical protein